MAPAKKTNGVNSKTAIEVGAAALALAAAAGATYYFYGDKDAKKHRVAATKWAKGLKADVLAEAKKLKAVDRTTMTSVVNNAMQAYVGARNVDVAQLKAAAAELKKNWRQIEAEVRGSTAKSAPAKATKKSVATPRTRKSTQKGA